MNKEEIRKKAAEILNVKESEIIVLRSDSADGKYKGWSAFLEEYPEEGSIYFSDEEVGYIPNENYIF